MMAIDPITVAAIVSAEFEPRDVARRLAAGRGYLAMPIGFQPKRSFLILREGRIRSSFWLDEDHQWDRSVLNRFGLPLPQTALAALTGHDLTRVVDHKLIVAGQMVADIEQHEGLIRFIVDLGDVEIDLPG